MENALIAIGIGLAVWIGLLACILALFGFERMEMEDRQRSRETRRMRAGTAWGREL